MRKCIVIAAAMIGIFILPASSYGATWASEAAFERFESSSNELVGVSCTSSTACTGVGSYTKKANGEILTLALGWNGKEWSLQETPNPAGETDTVLLGVSCISSTECFAVGGAQHGLDTQITLVEFWNGKEWKIQKSPNPTGALASILHGVSCSSATACIAVGDYVNSGGTNETLAESWNGKEWSILKSPNPTGATFSELVAVSCTASNACTAVGNYTNKEGDTVTLVERWNGTEWVIQISPNPAEETKTVLLGVLCISSTECFAVGGAQHGLDTQITLVEFWNGKEWKIQKSPNPTGALASVLQSVSCSSSTACETVGDYVNSLGTNETLAEGWNGKEWVIQETPSLTATFSALFGVSCTAATACSGVGAATNKAGIKLALMERYS